jgi:hypothetical protein
MRTGVAALLGGLLVLPAAAKDPDCAHRDAWPASMAFVELKNAGLIKPELIDGAKTSVRLLASQKVGRDRYSQVHLVRFTMKAGAQVSVLTVNEASHDECSLSDVRVFLVAQELGAGR